MNIEQIKELMRLLEDSTLNSLEVSEGEFSIHLEKSGKPEFVTMPSQMAMSSAMPVQMPAQVAVTQDTAAAVSNKGAAVKAPMVGVFYATASPEDEPYVSVGDTVKKGQVLCIIEAMKLMNEILAEKDGVIAEVCLESGQVVEYGQPLFYLQ